MYKQLLWVIVLALTIEDANRAEPQPACEPREQKITRLKKELNSIEATLRMNRDQLENTKTAIRGKMASIEIYKKGIAEYEGMKGFEPVVRRLRNSLAFAQRQLVDLEYKRDTINLAVRSMSRQRDQLLKQLRELLP